MAKLTNDQLEEARAYIRNWELEKLNQWMINYKIVIDRSLVIKTFQKLQLTDSSDRAIEMFNAAFVNMDPTIDRITSVLKKVCLTGLATVSILGFCGGIWIVSKTFWRKS